MKMKDKAVEIKIHVINLRRLKTRMIKDYLWVSLSLIVSCYHLHTGFFGEFI